MAGGRAVRCTMGDCLVGVHAPLQQPNSVVVMVLPAKRARGVKGTLTLFFLRYGAKRSEARRGDAKQNKV